MSINILQDINYLSTTNCEGTTVGALYIAGGINIAKDIIIGGVISCNGIINNNNNFVSSKWHNDGDNIIWFGSAGNYNVGINTSTPSFNLDINGSIRANSITTGILHVDNGSTITNIYSTSITVGTLISDIVNSEKIQINIAEINNAEINEIKIGQCSINKIDEMLHFNSTNLLPVYIPNGIISGYLFNKDIYINPTYMIAVSNLKSYGLYILNFSYWSDEKPNKIFSSWYVTYGFQYVNCNVININENISLTCIDNINLVFNLNGKYGLPWYDYGVYSCTYTKISNF